jgi:alpha-tubulin suppressor-like RCC1 family protein
VVAVLTSVSILVITPKPADAAAPTFTSIGLSYLTVCGLTADGVAYCWGSNGNGQVGNGTTTNALTPTLVNTAFTWKQISPNETTCAIRSDDKGYCWGEGWGGQIGNGSTGSDVPTPAAISGNRNWALLSTSQSTTCGVTTGSEAYCWGLNTYGQIGDSSYALRSTPRIVAGGHLWSTIETAHGVSCGITTAGDAYCWGSNGYGELGIGTATGDATSPQPVQGGLKWLDIDVGDYHTCGIAVGGDAYCWGRNTNGVLGVGNSTSPHTTPQPVVGGHKYTSISTDSGSQCAIADTGLTYCWGNNSYGELGIGNNTRTTTPTVVSGSPTFSHVVMGNGIGCGLTNVNLTYCWGFGSGGALGNGGTSNFNVPKLVFTDSVVNTVTVDVEASFSFATAGRAGACNGVVPGSGVSTGATAVGLGRVAPGTQSAAGQDLTVVSNADSGFIVYMRSLSQMTRAGGGTLAAISGSNALPGAFVAVGSEGVGYSTSDATLAGGTANRFTSPSANWAPLSLTDVPVMSHATTTSAITECVVFQTGISTQTHAGEYSALVVYTAVPTF